MRVEAIYVLRSDLAALLVEIRWRQQETETARELLREAEQAEQEARVRYHDLTNTIRRAAGLVEAEHVTDAERALAIGETLRTADPRREPTPRRRWWQR